MPRILGLIVLLSLAGMARACTIPVFRFALDRWQADAYTLCLPTEASATTADLLRPLRANGRANLTIVSEAGLLRPELRFPDSGPVVWSGDLGPGALDQLLQSAVRRELVRRLLAGDSVVWVICGGEAEEVARIEQRLKFLEQVAALPPQDPNDPDSRLGPGPPLRLKFSRLKIDAEDPGETVLRRMLAGPEGEADRPFAAAVFGRGRVLGAWPLERLDDRALEEACLFLVGRCSCQVKQQNPGWDLLLDVDWDQSLAAVQPEPAAEEPKELPVESPAEPSQTTVTEPEAEPRSQSWVVGLALLLAFASWRLLRVRTKD
jgi:hypothetical protein